MTYASNTQVAGNGDGIAFRLVGHGAELADSKRFAIFTDSCLHEKHWAF